jgi:hypothetical protein
MLLSPLPQLLDRPFMKELAYQAMKTDMQVVRLSQEMRDFKDEMKAFKEEMRGFEERAEQERREMNRRWGELANKMGTLAEDSVAPNLPRVARELFGCQEVDFFAVRVKNKEWHTRQGVRCDRRLRRLRADQ